MRTMSYTRKHITFTKREEREKHGKQNKAFAKVQTVRGGVSIIC